MKKQGNLMERFGKPDRKMQKYLITILLLFASLMASGQGTLTEEVVRIEASSAPMRSWLKRIEQQANIVLSYNSSLLDTQEEVPFTVGGRLTVRQMLDYLLRNYDYALLPMPGRKLLIQIKGRHTAPRQATAPPPIADRRLRIGSLSATLREWFTLMERQGNFAVTYPADAIDLDKTVKFDRPGELSVADLLAVLLKDYRYRLTTPNEKELHIDVLEALRYQLTGVVKEADTHETLLGATVVITADNQKPAYAITDENGFFNVSLLKGTYRITVNSVGYTAYEGNVSVERELLLPIWLSPLPYEMKSVQVKRRKSIKEMDEVAPSNMVSFSNADLFSQVRILPGVSASTANTGFNVLGGASDENLTLLEGFPVYNPNHLNVMLSPFNGDALKSVSFYNGYMPAQYEGRLSSITDVRLRDGNKRDFVNTLSLDMPAASAVFEGPIVKNKLSYLVGGRRSWLDFFDGFESDEDKLNHSFYDLNLKLAWDIDSVSSLKLMAYNSVDDYHIPYERNNHSVLHWNNLIYALNFNTLISPKVTNSTAFALSSHTNRADAGEYGVDTLNNLRSRIHSIYMNTEFAYHPGRNVTMRWGLNGIIERYELDAFGAALKNRNELTKHLSLFYDTKLRLTNRLYAQMGFNSVFYIPTHYRRYFSFQPRLSLKWSPGSNDMLSASLSRSEQFFHHIMVTDVSTPFDFIMPSIEGFAPSNAMHYELGWKHYSRLGIMELSAYYKRRHRLLALRPDIFIEDSDWGKYIMCGEGDSYGIGFYLYQNWKHFRWQLSYSLSKSHEWFGELKERGKMPSLYDIPHILNGAVSYSIGRTSMITLGGNLHSGKIAYNSFDDDIGDTYETFRKVRDPMRYRVDASYTFHKDFRKSKLLFRLGLFNILGNASDYDMFYYFSIKIKNHCVPFGTISFKF